ncbi:hypothetical protein CANTEDRAFT_115783 [Yamadazyma tenuis ATCC 10573]|uniref:Uncharacterized protein n=2 Tax=Candida tenuis TaxID=2315449 RepID=G3B7U3_CANTC|nr:uncharacterized protein CANTEDRAFT_115783 [Yamadazyma tenuis ATCC 10573]EGV62323.1 hypothetical protein CANTEDRAFT_115783 [Yamadazyma tenuis ATCC 10573]
MLHLAFEYGNFECISTFVEFLYNLSPNKAANLKLIKTFENSKNNNGWLPIELSVNFKLTRYYASFKDKLTSSSSNSNSDLDESISRGSYGTSSFKDSSSMLAEIPFVLGSDTRSNLRLEPDSSFSIDSSKSTTNGSPSPNKILASPIISVNEFNKRSHSQSLPTQSEEDIYSALRQRANTTLTPVALPLIPPTPSVIKKIPSLKSITISPSMRLDTEVDPIGIESSSSSTTTTSNSSPIKTTFPSIKTTSVKTDVKSSRTRSDSSAANEDTALVNSPSSIAAKIAFNSSKSSAASSRKNSNPEPSPVRLQNSNSNSQMRRDSSSSPLSHQNLQSPGSKQHLSPSKHKNSINSISFSRVR